MKTSENKTEIYYKALNSMPINFTSHLFVNKLRKSGIPNHEILNHSHYYFLLGENIRISKFRWQKKSQGNQITLQQQQPTATPSMTNQQMITHLKSEGYKVLKPTWDEL